MAPRTTAITCPVCRSTMKPIVVRPPRGGAVTLDTCDRCGAIWFDRGELERGVNRRLSRVHTQQEVDYVCPRCGVHLWEQTLGKNDCWASACTQCEGVLIDGASAEAAISLHPRAPRMKAPPVDYLKDINVSTCKHCGREADDTEWVLSLRVTGLVCRPCRKQLDLLSDEERNRGTFGEFLDRLFDD